MLKYSLNKSVRRIFKKPGVNFINMFTHSFYSSRSQKHKKTVNSSVFFALLGSAHVKALYKRVGEIDPWFKTDFGIVASLVWKLWQSNEKQLLKRKVLFYNQ